MNTSDKISISYITFEENAKNPAPDGQIVQKRPPAQRPGQGTSRSPCPHYEAGGSSPPVPLRQGHWPCTRSATYNLMEQNCFRMKLGERNKQHHGRNENDKNSGWENTFSHRLFFRFPRMLKHPVGGNYIAAGPWGGSAAANSQTYNLLLPRGFCVLRTG